jgi:hypothetical protein
MEGHEAVLGLPPDVSFISNPPYPTLTENSRGELVYRNYYNNSILGSSLMPIDWGGSSIVHDISRPYPAKDPHFGDVQILAGEFILDTEKRWTGFQVPLGAAADILSRAAEIEIPFRFYDFRGDIDNFKFIIQIGSLSGRDFPFIENPELVWEKQIFPAGAIAFNESVHIVKFILDETDRLKLQDARGLRIIIIYEGSTEISGRILLAPPIVRGAAFRAITVENGIVNGLTDQVTAAQTREVGANTLESTYGVIMQRLHPNPGTQRVLEIRWRDLMPGVHAGVDGRITQIPLSDYRELSFFVKGPQSQQPITGDLLFIVTSGPNSLSDPQLEVRIPLSAFSPDHWRKVTIRYQGSNTGITVDGGNAAGAVFRYKPLAAEIDDSGRTSYIAILADPGVSFLPAGSVFIDEIILEDAILIYRMNAGAVVEYSMPGTLLSFAGNPVLADFSVFSAFESEVSAGTETDINAAASMVNRTSMNVSVFGTRLSGNLAFTAADNLFLWSADHSISRTFGAFSVRETFFASPQTNTARHNINLLFSSDFFAGFDADAFYDFSRLRQSWNLSTGYRPPNELIPAFLLNVQAVWVNHYRLDENENYGNLWLKTFSPLVPDAGSGADSRRVQVQFTITQRTRPVGAVLNFNGSTNFSSANRLTRSENSLFLDVPIVLERRSINLRAGRSFKRELNFFGQDIFDDANIFMESIEDYLPLWGVFPFYSLFAPETRNVMENSLANSPSANNAQYTAFNDHFSVRIMLPSVYNLSALFIPARIIFRIERVLEQKMDINTDVLNLGGSFGFSAINMFGAMGYSPVFNFYQTDEYSHSIDASIIIPQGEDISWRVNSIFSAGFRGFSGGVFNLVNTFTIRSGGYWVESLIAFWETPTEKSLLSMFYNWIASSVGQSGSWNNLSSLLNTNYEQLRRESLEITFDNSSNHLRWSITLGHEEIVRILGRLNFTAFIKLRFSEDLFTEFFTIDAKIGTTLRISL